MTDESFTMWLHQYAMIKKYYKLQQNATAELKVMQQSVWGGLLQKPVIRITDQL